MWRTFIALGDSLAEGWGEPAGGERPRSWNDWLADGLRAGVPQLRFVNLGWRGSTVGDVLRDQLPPALGQHPDLVTVTVGANDALAPTWSAERFATQLRAVLEPLAQSGAKVLTFAYPRAAGSGALGSRLPTPPGWDRYARNLAEVNREVRRVGADVGAFCLDFEHLAAAGDPENLSADLVHPNARGYLLLGQTALRRLLAETAP